MAFPPTVPPANRTNATPQVDNHPGDHNQISAALSDIINELSALETTINNNNRRVGCGIYTGSQFSPAQSNASIVYGGEAYDTDNMHAPNGTDVVIPATGVYACTQTVITNAAISPVAAGYAGLNRLVLPGGTVKQNIIIAGQTTVTLNYTGPFNANDHIHGEFWNGGGDNYISASLEVLRVAL